MMDEPTSKREGLLRDKSDYLEIRSRYEPQVVNLIVVAESPPASGLYFYCATGSVKEPLFSALMKSLGASPTSKDEGLKLMASRGWVLVDATYEPVDKNRDRDAVILRDYAMLCDDLLRLSPDMKTAMRASSEQASRHE
jgi:hypothetical protein